ncbi:MAG: PhzF family phenazine biosynthesis protein [Planctomycetaceae bacterium]
MTRVPCWQVDAFTDRPYAGNSAAVCLLESAADAGWMQAVAMEMNLSETSFVRRLDDGFELRWFTPKAEVDLCGHATLAAAHALWTEGVAEVDRPIRFHTLSGPLTSRRAGELIELDFPAMPPSETVPPPDLIESLGVQPLYLGRTRCDYFVLLDAESAVRAVRPDFRRLSSVETRGVIVTAPSDDERFDFVSRFFAPALGIDEDPVCGSAHCSLGPFWVERLGKSHLTGFQASTRGGIIHVRPNGDRVILGGQAVTVLRGELV